MEESNNSNNTDPVLGSANKKESGIPRKEFESSELVMKVRFEKGQRVMGYEDPWYKDP